jgi:transcriptional regulator with XRE-family HTH domain
VKDVGRIVMLGDKIRTARKAKKITIAELAEKSGFSSGYISSVERGLVNPSLSALYKLTSVLDIDTGFLFQDDAGYNQSNPVVHENERLRLAYPGSLIHYELLTRSITSRKAEFLRIAIPPGKGTGVEPLVHDGEEYGLVLNGNLEITLGEKIYKLGPGDSIFFSSTTPHGVVNSGSVKAEAIWVMIPPRL